MILIIFFLPAVVLICSQNRTAPVDFFLLVPGHVIAGSGRILARKDHCKHA